MPDRKNQRLNLGQAGSQAWSHGALAPWQIQAPFPLEHNYVKPPEGSTLPWDPDAKVLAVTAPDANDPNTTAPAADRIFRATVGVIGLYVICSVATVWEVWVRTNLPEGIGPAWVCVKRAISFSATVPERVVVEVGFSEACLRCVSGPAVDKVATVLAAVA